MTDRIRARHEGTRRILPHNDLIAAAAYHKEVIEEKIASNDRRAIAYDYLACMLALSFSVEAIVNFVGQSKVTPWNEKAPTKDKYKTVLRELNLTPDWNKSPYCSVSKLKDFRDLIVHPKPIIEEFDEEVVMPASEADRPSLELDSEWMNYCWTVK